MATLHIVRQSAYNTDDFAQCLQVLNTNDVIVFIDDGCYNLQHSLLNTIESSKNIQLQVITQHASARAVSINDAIFTKITMDDLVSLTFENDRVITWQ
ncbi:MAG: sulfurtransferase complex subunit TusB [Colwellia sp.]|nr:sulfurtransferase complex subunit TusB [Colwellia sp.]